MLVNLFRVAHTLHKNDKNITLDCGPEPVGNKPVEEGKEHMLAGGRTDGHAIGDSSSAPDWGSYPVDSFLAVTGSMPHLDRLSFRK